MKFITSAILIFFSVTTHAQGIYQLWGSTAVGGTDNSGVIFSTGATGNNYQSRYQLYIKSEGNRPLYSDPVAFNGKLYGVTSQGGSNNKGIIYEWDPLTNEYFKKIDFNGFNGATPEGSLVLNGNKFYGMTFAGGLRDSGIIFEYDPLANILSKKIDLNKARGANPVGNLTFNNGKFYGMTTAGGTAGKGVIFEWDPVTNLYTNKINLATSTGAVPFGTLTLFNNKFYGSTTEGGLNNLGVIFEWDPASNVYTKKADLSSTTGSKPYGQMVLYSNKLYGTTNQGGASGVGVLFEYDPVANIYLKKVDLNFTNGSNPYGSLVFNAGKFYGLAFTGGNNFYGTIFEWDPATTVYTKLQDLYTVFGRNPYGSLAYYAGKFYGMTNNDINSYGGIIFEWDPVTNTNTKKIDLGVTVNERYPIGHFVECAGKYFEMVAYNTPLTGGIIEWDPSTNTYAKRYDFKSPTGSNPFGSLTVLNNKIYGMTQRGGLNDKGVIFEWDPITYNYIKKIDFSDATGAYPLGYLTYLNGKFYGMTSTGGDYQTGVIFEWDPVTNVYTKKIDFLYSAGQWPMGNTPWGSLTAFNGKLYGMTTFGGTANLDNGVLFEWDPLTNIYLKKYDFNGNNGKQPKGSLTLYNNKFYGVTSSGGVNNVGVIFEWDPVTGTYSKRLDFGGGNGNEPQGDLVESGGKFYGVTKSGGNNSFGMLYEWDPVTNVLIKKKDFAFNDANSPDGNFLSLFRAPVSRGIPGSCAVMNTITIDNSNNNVWVPITDNAGDAVAEIKANGNNLGVVNTSLYIHNRPVREDALFRLYLDRNISITPQFQPSSPVDIRIYLKGAELEALKNAFNSLGQPSGVNTINDVTIFKNSGSCQPVVQTSAFPVTGTGAAWNNDYVITASINQFSSFFIANKALSALPVTFLDFTAVRADRDAMLRWRTENEINLTRYDVERSTDGIVYTKIGAVTAVNQPGQHQYDFKDAGIFSSRLPIVYYRIRQIDADGRFAFTRIVSLRTDNAGSILVSPNPVSSIVTLQVKNIALQHTEAVLTDIQGKIMAVIQLNDISTKIDMGGFSSGIYLVKTIDGSIVKLIKN